MTEEPDSASEVSPFWHVVGLLFGCALAAVVLFGFATVGLALAKAVLVAVNWAWNW